MAAGCATAPPPIADEPAPPPPPELVAVAPAVEPPPPAPVAAPVRPARIDVALAVDPSAPIHGQVAERIAATLPPARFRIARLDEETAPRARAAAVIAVGRAAVLQARRDLPGVPIVFCQVLRPESLGAAREPLFGVAAWPPAAVSLAAWRAIDPGLRTVMLIVSDPASALVADARDAARALGIDLSVETSSSDRETLYLFRRFAATVDGLWLLPDERALGPTSLVELVRYAAARDVGVLAFSEALLPRGALLSAMSDADDVAATVQRVVERVATGRADGLPRVTPLSAASLAVNRAVADELGLPSPRLDRWVAREFD